MRPHPETVHEEPLLSDRAASYFGGAGRAAPIRERIRSNGVLTLTEHQLLFEPDEGFPLAIPVETIDGLGMGRWLEGVGGFTPVLKVIYRDNLVFGVQVVHPERWIEAMESLTRGRKLAGARSKGKKRLTASGNPRRLILATVVLLIVLSMALPVFFSWIHGTVLREQEASSLSGLRTAP